MDPIKEELKKKIIEFGNVWLRHLSNEEINLLIKYTNFLPSETEYNERRFYLLNGLTEIQTCPICGKKLPFAKREFKNKSFCSNECRFSEEGKQISKQRRAQTNIEKFGSENAFQSDFIKEKIKKTNFERYGVFYPSQSESIREKTKQTYIKHYGVDHPQKSKEIKEKTKKTNIKRYGCVCTAQNEIVKEKNLITKRNNYFDVFVKLCNNKFLIPLFEKELYVNAIKGTKLNFRCERCGKEFEYIVDRYNNSLSIQHISCPDQSHRSSSKNEQEIYDWLISIGLTNIERNKRDWNVQVRGKEADIYLPDYKLAIEYNGLYWHSNTAVEKDYHFNKWKFFKELGIDCIQIFENEWRDKPNIVKGIILNKLGKNKKIYARKCIVKEISNNEYENFLNENHIQGYHQAKVRLGLFYEDELVEVMSFSKPRFNKKYDWENIRTCTKIGYNVVGGFSKLLKFFRKSYHGSIISYIDNRYFSGRGYIKNGFHNIGRSKPNYFYFRLNDYKLYNRMDFQKHKLKDRLECFNPSKTEQENMALNNYYWVYDCGDNILVYK